MEVSLVNICLGCWAFFGLYIALGLLDRVVFSFFNARTFFKNSEKYEEE
jgi:hypothetical protein